MNKAKVIVIIAFALLAVSSANAFAFIMDVDGKLNEWGVTPGVYGSSQWTPNSGIYYTVEDTAPGQNYVGPGYGGQLFDVEAMYLTRDTNNVYYAIVTGFPSGGVPGYTPGDIAFDFGNNGLYEYGISTKDRNGFTAGSLYSVSEWNKGLWTTIDPLSNPTSMKTGAFITSDGKLIYTAGNYLGDHYVMEGYVPITAFGASWGQDFTMHWAMSCGNDYLNLDPPFVTPEPGTMALLLVGIPGFIFLRRRKRIAVSE